MLGKILTTAGRYALNRLSEPSGYAGLAAFAYAVFGGDEATWGELVGAVADNGPRLVAAIAGTVAMLVPDRGAKD